MRLLTNPIRTQHSVHIAGSAKHLALALSLLMSVVQSRRASVCNRKGQLCTKHHSKGPSLSPPSSPPLTPPLPPPVLVPSGCFRRHDYMIKACFNHISHMLTKYTGINVSHARVHISLCPATHAHADIHIHSGLISLRYFKSTIAIQSSWQHATDLAYLCAVY